MKTAFAVAILAVFASAANAQITCGADGKITIAGSSTVFPVSAAFATEYSKACPLVQFNTTAGGSSTGAKCVCGVAPECDIGNLSRDFRATEATTTDTATYTCAQGDTTRTVVQIPVAIDAVTIMVGLTSTIYNECIKTLPAGLSSAEIRWLFSNLTTIPQPAFSDDDPTTFYWSEICGTDNPKIPAKQKVKAYVPRAGAGTTDYFREIYFTGGDGFRKDIDQTLADNDAPLRDAIADDPFGIGFFGFSYYEKNTNKMYGIPVDGIAPTAENLLADKYLPLGRRIYSNYFTGSLERTSCYGYFGLSSAGATLVSGTGFLPIPETEYATFRTRLGVCGQSEAPTLAPTARPPACRRFCWFFQSAETCCSTRRKNRGTCKCI